MHEIDISKLNKAAVLAALYDGARPQGMGFMHYTPEPLTPEEAEAALKASGPRMSFDYLRGRVMKVDLAGDVLRVGLYDRDNGPGAAEAALRSAGLITAGTMIGETPATSAESPT